MYMNVNEYCLSISGLAAGWRLVLFRGHLDGRMGDEQLELEVYMK